MKVLAGPSPSKDVPPLASSSVRLAAGARMSRRVVAPALPLPLEFRTVYDEWFEPVSRWIRALGGLEADRDDIVQEVFLVVRRRLFDFDGGNLAGWLYRITRRQVRDFRRRAWVRHIFTRRRLAEPDTLPHDALTPATAFEHKEKQRILQALLAKMKEERRIAFVLFEIDGLSGEEIARIQGVPLNTVWTRLHHARKDFFALAAKFQNQGKTR